MRCEDCGDTADFAKNPHWTKAVYCPKQDGKGKPPFKKTEARLRKVEHDHREGDSTDGELTDREDYDSDKSSDRANNWAGGRAQKMGHIGLSAPSYNSIDMLRPQARCIIMFKYRNMFYTAAGEADTGSQFSLITVGFTKLNRWNYRKCNAQDIFRLTDLSGTRVDITGYIDLEINTVSGERYHWTRILVREGEENDLIIGRSDLRMLQVIGCLLYTSPSPRD